MEKILNVDEFVDKTGLIDLNTPLDNPENTANQ